MTSVPKVDAVLEAALQKVRADGIAVGAAVGGLTAFAAAGTVDGAAVDRHTVMYGASVTKQFIGLLLAQAVESEHLSAEDPLRRWVPELPVWTADIRLSHLLHHTSGLPDVTSPADGVPASNAEVVARLQRTKPLRAPGRQFAYNNTGYVLLAEVLSRVFQQPIEVLATEQIFRPLAMTNSRLSSVPPRPTAEPAPPGTVGDGGLWTTVHDLVLWLDALNADRPEPAAAHRVTARGCLEDGTSLSYAWGVQVSPSPAGPRISHGGSWADWLAKTVRLPERRIAVAVLSIGGEENEISTLGTDLADRLVAV